MAKIILPDSIFGKQVDGAMERVMKAEQKKQISTQQPIVNALRIDGFIYVPSVNLYFAKERTLQTTDWTETHKKLNAQTLNLPHPNLPHKPKLRMPAPEETLELIFYLKDNLNKPEFREVYDDILKTTPEGTWHGEWQNAIFSEDNKIMYVQRVTGIDSKGEIILSAKAKLEDCLEQDGWAELSRKGINSQGLCKIPSNLQNYAQGENIYFWHPRAGYVARLGAGSGRAILRCDRHPDDSGSSLGVRACAEGAAPKK